MRVFPFSNALVERCISTMNKIKSDWRSNLVILTVDVLLRIKKMESEIDTFSPKKSVELFFAKIQPYGPHKQTSISTCSTCSNSPKCSITVVQIDSEPEENESSVA